MGYLWTGQEWIWNPAHGPEGGPSRYAAHKKPVQALATCEEMQAYLRNVRPADKTVRRLFAEIAAARYDHARHRERRLWAELVEYLACQPEP
jgi:hypothetical protein